MPLTVREVKGSQQPSTAQVCQAWRGDAAVFLV